MRERASRLLSIAAAAVAAAGVTHLVWSHAVAQEGPDWNKGLPRQHDSKWLVHDITRPKPATVTPGEACGGAPSDAIVLFDGTSLDEWNGKWKVESGYMEVNDTGSISTKRKFGDCQLHLEYMAPKEPRGVSQARGNSGIIFMGKYEVQVLDNFENPTYPDGYIGSVYGQHPPLVNAGREPGEWQVYDVVFRRPRFGDDGEVVEPARFTVFLNGVLVQHNAEVFGGVRWRALASYSKHEDALPIVLQDHGDKQTPRFRNIWIRELDLSPEAIDNAK